MGGSGKSYISRAVLRDADAYITGDLGHHDFVEYGKSIMLIDASHKATEIPVLEEIKKRFNGSVCFRTDLDRQNVTLFGTPDDVRKHIDSVFSAVGSEKGGVIACGEIGRDTPLDNIKAMYETFMEFRF